MSKYYTPTIEEFHVGFEFEEVVNGMWVNDVFEPNLYIDDREIYSEGIESESIRVKFLDQEDIENLGFEHSESNKKEVIYYRSCDNQNTKQEVRLWFDKEFDYIEIKDLKDKHDLNYMFRGKIKNKSELEKVLKMIGYENTKKD